MMDLFEEGTQMRRMVRIFADLFCERCVLILIEFNPRKPARSASSVFKTGENTDETDGADFRGFIFSL